MARKKKEAKHDLIFYFDTETEGFSGKAIFAQICHQTAPVLSSAECLALQDEAFGSGSAYCIEDCFDHLVEIADTTPHNAIVLYAHNASYDLMRLRGHLPGSDIRITLNGGQLVFGEMRYKGHTVIIRDSYRLLAGSLKKLSESFAPLMPKLSMNHLKGFQVDNIEDVTYALRDVTTLRAIMNNFVTTLNSGRHSSKKPMSVRGLKVSVASLAIYLVKEALQISKGEKKSSYKAASKEINVELHKNYYRGGMVVIPNGHNPLEKHVVSSEDITSSYPFQMGTYSFPNPGAKPKKVLTIPKSGRFVVKLNITNYRGELAILPLRTLDGLSYVYPHGTFTTHITDVEYNFLTTYQQGDYDAIEIEHCLHYKESQCSQWTKPFIDQYYHLKSEGDRLNTIEQGSGDALRALGKNLLNNSYGKFAEKYRDADDELGSVIRWNDDHCGYASDEQFHDESDEADEKESREHDGRNVILSTLVTGHARVQLYTAIYYYGVKHCRGGDTDSIKIDKAVHDALPPMPNAGDALGEWKTEGYYEDYQLIAPKVYAGIHHEGTKSKLEVKAKGTPLTNITALLYKADNRMLRLPRSSTDVAQNKAVDDQYSTLIRDAMTNLVEVEVLYSATPNNLKTFIRTGQLASTRKRSLAQPANTKAMQFINGRYYYHVVTPEHDTRLDT